MAREAPRWADQSSDENVRTRWSALQEELQGLNRATRAVKIGTAEQDEHGASNSGDAARDQARKNTSASVPMAAERAVRRWASRYAELDNPACNHPRRRNSKALAERGRIRLLQTQKPYA